MSTRDDYIDGKLFSVGDIVVDQKRETIHEIINLGTNYVTTVGVDGEITRHWVENLVLAESLRKDFLASRRRRSSGNQIAHLGFKTSHLNESMYQKYYQPVKKAKEAAVVVEFLTALDEAMEILSGPIDQTLLVRLNKSIDVVSKFAPRLGTDSEVLEKCRALCNEELLEGQTCRNTHM